MILVISNMYPSKKYPNYGVFVKNFYKKLSLQEKAKIIYMTKTTSKLKKIYNYLNFYMKVFMNCLFSKYKIIYVHYAGYNAPPILMARLFNKKAKLIVNVHGSDVTPEKKLEEKTNFLTKYLIGEADLTIVPSIYFEDLVKDKYGKNVNTWISPSGGIDFTVFNSQKKQYTNEKLTIGYVSRIDKEKGWDLLLYAIRNLIQKNYDIQLIMVGDGAQNEEALALIKELNLEKYVEKHNCLSQKKLVHIYSSLDIFIFPSMREGESLGLVGLESMACGTPVIGSNLGGIKTYVKNGENGFLFEPGNQEDLEYMIEKYDKMTKSEQKMLSINAIKTAKKYDSEEVNKNLVEKITVISGKSE